MAAAWDWFLNNPSSLDEMIAIIVMLMLTLVLLNLAGGDDETGEEN